MAQLTVTKTKDYLVLKIPLEVIKQKKSSISSQEKKAILEGLKAFQEGRVSKSFKDAKEATSFLKNI